MQIIQFPHAIPYCAQVASRELALQVFSGSRDAKMDPRWAESGAGSEEEYAYWVMRACGIACVKMCAEAFNGPQLSLHEWIDLGLHHQGYLISMVEGQKVEKGWIHRKLAELLEEKGLYAKAVAADMSTIVESIQNGFLVIASVSYQLGTYEPITIQGGHLVVISGVEIDLGVAAAFYLQNPSGRYLALQENARIAAERFLQAYSGRVILVSDHPF